MTRQEAIKKTIAILGIEDEYAIRKIELLEALGLIKFDEEVVFYDKTQACSSYSLQWLQNLVGENGYTIVKSS